MRSSRKLKKPEKPPDAGQQYLRVSQTRYVLYFLLFFLILSIMEIRVERRTDYGLQRVERLWRGNHMFIENRPQPDLNTMARELSVQPEELMTAHYVTEALLNRLEREERPSIVRVITADSLDYRYYISARFFLNIVIAAIVALALYYRRRSSLAEELIEYHLEKFARVNNQLETKMAESTRIIEKLNKLQDKLVDAEKLASIGRLSATLAHEIRNPLSIIKSSTDIVQDGLEERSQPEAALNLIRDEINRLDRIISDLLNFARPKEPRLERIWIRSIVRHWLPPVVEELEKDDIQLVPQLENVDGEVLIDPDQLYQVFLNLMWNARDAVRGQANSHIFVRLEEGDNQFVKLSIQDTGTGMLPDVLRQIREPFYTTKTQGTGLGIPVALQLLEGMGGRLQIESILEFGTTVTLLLPRAGSVRQRTSSESLMILSGKHREPKPEALASPEQ